MGAEEEQKDESRSRFSFYDFGYSSRDNCKEENRQNACQCNVQDNQVLVWANDIENGGGSRLAGELGELPPPGGRQSTLRVVDASRQPETYEYLKRLKEQ